uniref:EF-hand domain-containing protein n=2 Tax=Sus scrofa TaxID=9823 RepID=A0A8W4FPT2_PIG
MAQPASKGESWTLGASLSEERRRSLYPPAVANPFLQQTHISAGRWATIILLGSVLVPLRVSCMALLFIFLWPLALLPTLGRRAGANTPARSCGRRLARLILKLLLKALFFVAGFRVTVKGEKAPRQEARILVAAPHSSFFDAIVCVVAGLPSVVSASQNARIPVAGKFLLLMQPVLVSRDDPESRRLTREEILKRVTSDGKWYPNTLDTVTWTWQGFTGFQACVLTLSQLFTRVEVEFMPVYIPSDRERRDPVLFANSVRVIMANALGVPVTDHTYEDCRLMVSAGNLRLPMEAGLVEFTKISQKLKLDWDHIHQHLDEYAAMAAASRGGKIGIKEFADYLKLPVSEPLRQLFALFDRNNDGSIDFREYVIGLSVLCNPARTERILQMSFRLFDLDDDGFITEQELAALLRAAFGVPDLDVSQLFREMAGQNSEYVSYMTFKNFALKHPEYAKLFSSYLDLQAAYVYSLPEEVAA